MSTSVLSYTVLDEVVNLLTPTKYIVLYGNFVFDLRNVFPERIPGEKRDLPVQVLIFFQ
jgi:hypothetical protein